MKPGAVDTTKINKEFFKLCKVSAVCYESIQWEVELCGPLTCVLSMQWKKEQVSRCYAADVSLCQYVNQLYNTQIWTNLFFFPLLLSSFNLFTHPLGLCLEESLRVSGLDPESHSQVILVGRLLWEGGVVDGVVGQRDAHLGLGDDEHLPEAEMEVCSWTCFKSYAPLFIHSFAMYSYCVKFNINCLNCFILKTDCRTCFISACRIEREGLTLRSSSREHTK